MSVETVDDKSDGNESEEQDYYVPLVRKLNMLTHFIYKLYNFIISVIIR